jgi:hypothetical protein
MVSHTSTTTILLSLFFLFLRLTSSNHLYLDFPAPRVLRLGIQHDPAVRMDQYSLRRILMSIRTLHAPWVLAAAVFEPLRCRHR